MIFKKTLLAAAMLVFGGFAMTASAGTATGQFNVTLAIQSTCKVDAASDIAFGVQAANTAANISASNAIAVACTNGTAYSVNLQPSSIATAHAGNSSTTGGGWLYSTTTAQGVPYQLHSGSATGTDWGNTGNDVATTSGTGTGMTHDATYNAYATIVSTDFKPGTDYSDIVQVSVAY